jgi:hypothetical protein
VLRQISEHKSWVEAFRKVESALGDLDALRELAAESPDEFPADDLDKEAEKFVQLFDELETRAMLKDPNDSKSAIIHIHPGAGGTESSDWAVDALPHVYAVDGAARLESGRARFRACGRSGHQICRDRSAGRIRLWLLQSGDGRAQIGADLAV